MPLHWKILGLNKSPAYANVNQRLETVWQDIAKPTARDRENFYRQTKQEVQNALEPFGYFQARISTRWLDKQHRQLLIQIVPGRRMRISALTILITGPGRQDADLQTILKNPGLKRGEYLNIDAYKQLKMRLFQVAERTGYIKARVSFARVNIDKKKYQTSITLHFDTGPRYYFGPVTFRGGHLENSLLTRYVQFSPGQAYNSKALQVLQGNLQGSHYFQSVRVTPQVGHETQVPIQVELKPNKTSAYTFGAGYGTDTGIRGSVGWNWRRINRYGHHMQALVQGSTIESNVQARYIIPGRNPVTDQYVLAVLGLYQNYPKVRTFGTQITAGYISAWKEWQRTISLNALIERRYQLANSPPKTTRWLFPSLTLRRVHADNAIITKNGYRFTLRTQGSIDALLADGNFIQAEVSGKFIKTLGRHTHFIARGRVGMTATDRLGNLANNLLFYGGGSQSVRGYDYQELGPGKYLYTGGFDLQQNIKGPWRIGVFYDFGNASNKFLSDIKQSIGIGINRESPIGMINVGIARSFDKKRSIKFVFSLGPDLA